MQVSYDTARDLASALTGFYSKGVGISAFNFCT